MIKTNLCVYYTPLLFIIFLPNMLTFCLTAAAAVAFRSKEKKIRFISLFHTSHLPCDLYA